MLITRTALLSTLALTGVLALSGCFRGVNGSVRVPPGTSHSSASTVNGSVVVGNGASVGKRLLSMAAYVLEKM